MTFRFDGVWDIEAASWDRFLVGQWLSADGDRFVSWDQDEFFDSLLTREGAWYAHVGGRYDGLWFVEQCCRRQISWSAKMRGSGVLTCRAADIEIRDSFALAPMRLAKFSRLGSSQKCELGLPCECGDDCGGYCVLERPLTERERKLLLEYLDLDCISLLKALDALAYRAASHDIDLRLTVGSTAWNTAKQWYDLQPCGHDFHRYQQLRDGYYGGRTEVFQTRADFGYRFDIHSSYPAALQRMKLPVGIGHAYGPGLIESRFAAGMDGIYTADLTIPESHVPPLPVRMDDRLLYPVGPISGTWTGHELRYAIELGAELNRIRRGYVWASSDYILRPFAERVWAIRDSAAKGDEADQTYAAWIKWLANSLTGKLAQKPEHKSLDFVPEDETADCPEISEGAEVVGCVHGGAFVVRTRERVDACAHVQWSAYLTAEARCELHRQLTHAETPYYCDTDSVYSRERLTRRVGDGLGEWGYEGDLRDWRALAPKVYSYCDSTGEWHVRGKGLSGLTKDGFDSLERGETWSIAKGVEGLRTAVRSQGSKDKSKHKKLFTRRFLARKLIPTPGWIGGRELEADGIHTRPTTVARYKGR